MSTPTPMPALVTVNWLAANLGAPDLRILDASFYLPAENADARARFSEAHIPGARFFDIDLVADQDTDLPHMLPTAGRFARLVGALGISNDHRVVVYDQKGIFSAPRAWWTFRTFGHAQIAVLDGGLPAWRAAGYATETGWAAGAAPQPYRPTLHATRVRGLGDMLANATTQAELVLDARPAARFAGTAPEPRPGLPRGHMPGAVSLPATDLIHNGRMRAPDALRARLTEAGANCTRPLVTTCGSGVSAAIITFALHLAGLPEGSLYDGSWTEWASTPGAPIATG